VAAALVTLIGYAFHAQATEADAEHQWQALNAQVMTAYQAGKYSEGTPLAEEALELAQQTFGERDANTLVSLRNSGRALPTRGPLERALRRGANRKGVP
jgi:ATP/maltotriose-dependent transcriptional regulator MalT